jgi:hypothetical protein
LSNQDYYTTIFVFLEYTIRNEYDSVEDAMFLTSTDNKQSEIVPSHGALVKKFKENWYLTLSGDKQFVIVPNLFDSCIIDAETMCTFGFSTTIWIKFTYNFLQYPIEKNFEQILFFFGAQDFSTGLEVIFYIYTTSDYQTNEQTYNYVITVNFKTSKYTITKHYRLFLTNIVQLNNLNCLTIQFSDVRNLTTNMNLNWLNMQLQEVDSSFSAKMSENNLLGRSYAPYSTANLGNYGLKASTLASSNSIGIIGDIYKQSYFNIKNFELRNHEASLENIEYDFQSANPKIYEFNSLEKLFEMPNVNIVGTPQIVETRYGKSLLFSKSDQKVTISNVTNSCFGNLNLCKNGYTLKLWICFTNYNLMKSTSTISKSSNLKTDDSMSAQKNMTKKIFLLSNGGQKQNRNGLSIIYDLSKNQLTVYAKTYKKWYKAEVNLKLKLYVWYVVSITWDQLDGLRLYINNRLLEHVVGLNYSSKFEPSMSVDGYNSEFTLGKADYEFDEVFDSALKTSTSKNALNLIDHNSLGGNTFENQTEDSDRLNKNINKNNRNYQINSYLNNYYEFIVHKLVQFDVRKYPDEIISKNIIVQGNHN